ncbi:MAG TPA: amino acid permease [Chryseolinea sp.]|nr:amino acid permease [Chryseolinea sp.]
MKPTPEQGLKRTIGVGMLTASAVNLTIGAGIFALPAVIASRIGSASFLAYIPCTLLIMMVMLCFIEIGTRVTSSGGIYSYLEAAFGPFTAFLGSTLYWLGYSLMTDAAVANVFADSLAVFFPGLRQPMVRTSLMLVIFGGIAWVNVLGVRQGASLAAAVTIAKIIPLLVLIVGGMWFVNPQYLKIVQWPSISSLGEVSMILFFAFGGMECSLGISGEIKNPTYTIPRGILMGSTVVFVFYICIHLVTQGLLGPDLKNHLETPLAAAAYRFMGNTGSTLLLVGAAISTFGVIIGDILNAPRLAFAAAKDGLLPGVLARIHPKYATPYVSIIFYAFLGFILSISGSFRQLAIMASAALLLTYLSVILAALKLRRTPAPSNAFKIPGGIVVHCLAIAVTLWFLSQLSREEYVIAGIFLIVAAGVFGVMNLIARNTRRS